ncbi:DUF2169 family type VI secretion system accessory protein [Bordetella petrii]|uniref:DUF2169 family type VI secretion system accessory protein n=1 Tax=Bordetella petrii TaxID=94624 RepID=UPI0009DD6D34|nr:DUF2169 domain-containing protein [Bordetella petrii]
MKIIKPLRLLVMPRPYRWRGGIHLAVTIGALCEHRESGPLLLPEHALMNEALPELDADEMLDFVMPKPHPEFLVSGHAYTAHQRDKTSCMVSVRVADKRKDVLVLGDRYWLDNRISDPQPFESMPLTWNRSFGGSGVPENPLGVGLEEAEVNGVRVVPLPNLESPTERIHAKGQRVRPCNMGMIRVDWPERLKQFGSWDQQWLEEVGTGFFDDMQPSVFNAAADDQIWRDRDELPLGEPFEIWNMQQEQQCWSGALPQLRARCFVSRRYEGGRLDEMAMRCTTVWFVPHQKRYILLFHGSLPIHEDDGHDVLAIMAAIEQAGQPRTREHYEQIYALRNDRQQAVLHAFKDDELMPGDMLAPWLEQTDLGSNAIVSKLGRLLGESGFPAGTFVGPVKPLTLGDLPELIEAGNKLREDTLAEHQAARAAALDPAWDDVKDERQAAWRKLDQDIYRNLDFSPDRKEDFVLPVSGPPELGDMHGPPKSLERRREYRQAAREIGKTPNEMADFVRSSMNKLYLYSVHYQNGVPRVGAHRAVALRERVMKRYRLGRDLSRMDLTGADLSGMDLSGADFTETWLENADFSGSNLSGAMFKKTVLARATLRNAKLDGATLSGCNISEAIFSGCALHGALWKKVISEKGTHIEDCTFEDARLENFDFERAWFTRVEFASSKLDSVDFRECQFNECAITASILDKTDFDKCKIAGMRVRSCAWTGAMLDETLIGNLDMEGCQVQKTTFTSSVTLHQSRMVDCMFQQTMFRSVCFSDADLSRCVFERCDLSEANFHGCTLRQIRTPQAMFVRANFDLADLSGGNFMYGVFQKASFIGAKLAGCNFFRADMSETLLDASTDVAGAYVHRTRLVPRRSPARLVDGSL